MNKGQSRNFKQPSNDGAISNYKYIMPYTVQKTNLA